MQIHRLRTLIFGLLVIGATMPAPAQAQFKDLSGNGIWDLYNPLPVPLCLSVLELLYQGYWEPEFMCSLLVPKEDVEYCIRQILSLCPLPPPRANGLPPNAKPETPPA